MYSTFIPELAIMKSPTSHKKCLYLPYASSSDIYLSDVVKSTLPSTKFATLRSFTPPVVYCVFLTPGPS